MEDITDQVTYQVGMENDEIIFLHSTVNPCWENPEKFVIEIFFKELKLPEMEEEKVTIARIDNKSHGGRTHLDQEFKEDPDKKFRDWGFYEAWGLLEEKWRKFSKKNTSETIEEVKPI